SERKGEGDAEDEESLVAPPNKAATSQIEALDQLGGKENEEVCKLERGQSAKVRERVFYSVNSPPCVLNIY
ncbi:hypothetical protein A2U01_0057228, partial [Trifolium medium]|nr:hypothetical protein [Trifolium medium]